MSEFVDRLLNALGGRVDKLKGIWNEPVGVDPSRPVRMLGQVAGGAGDVLGEVMRSAYTNLVPQSSQDRFSSAVQQIGQTPVGRAVGDALSGAVSAYRGFSERNPKTAGSLDAIANLSDFTPKGLVHSMIPFIGEIRGLKHGSPYKFDKFSDEFIGKGEGAQAFGHGHYLTEDENVAIHYADSAVNRKGLSLQAAENVTKTFKNGDYEALRSYAKDEMELSKKFGAHNEAKSWEEIYKSVNNDNPKLPEWLERRGVVYDVTVNKGMPNSKDVFLEWDKPVSEEYKKSLINYANSNKNYDNELKLNIEHAITGNAYNPNLTARELYQNLDWAFSNTDKARYFLNDAGFTGIKYPTGTLSGVKDSPYHNYVIFDPNRITIEGVRSGR